MTEPPRDSTPVELSPSNTRREKRQSSAHSVSSVHATYSNCVDTNIDSRIRSLLLSRNERRPPRTPHTSPENRRSSIEAEAIGQLNFFLQHTANQAFSSAQRRGASSMESARLSEADPPNLDGEVSRSISDPTLVISRRETILAEHGIDDCHIDSIPTLVVPPVAQGQPPTKSPFKIPRLVLRDVEPVNMMPVRSCGSANGDDLACLIAGCTHPLRSPLEIAILREEQARRLREDRKDKSLMVPRDVAAEAKRESMKVNQVKIQSQSLISPGDSVYSQEGIDSILINPDSSYPPKAVTRKRAASNVLGSGQLTVSPGPMVSAQSATLVDPLQQSISTVVTKFSIPLPELSGPNAEKEPKISSMDRPLIPKNEIKPSELAGAAFFRKSGDMGRSSISEDVQIVVNEPNRDETARHVRSIASLRSYQKSLEEPDSTFVQLSIAEQLTTSFNSKSNNPSLISGGSRKSVRHALLKPVVASSPPDNGLPAQPILTQSHVPRGLESGKVPGLKIDGRTQQASALESIQKAKEFVSTAEKQLRAYKIRSSPTSLNHDESLQSSLAVDKPKTPSRVTGSPDNLKFWGYPPSLKKGVEGAVQTAVRVAVRRIVVPPETETEVASVAYRKLFGQSLSNAAEVADTYLKRDGLWTEHAQNELSPLDSRENLMPSATATENDHVDPEWRSGKRCKYGASPAYAAIPTRDSSRKHIRSSSTLPSASAQISSAAEKGTFLAKEQNPAKEQSVLNPESNPPISWLKDIIGSTPAYETKFTQLPPRTTPGTKFSTGRTQSHSGPAKPTGPMSIMSMKERSKPAEASLVADINSSERKAVAESFSKTINDLESLLGEALLIARQAADKQDSGYVPAVLNNTALFPTGGSTRYRRSSIAVSEAGSLPSVHESLLSTSNSEASYNNEENDDFEDHQERKIQFVTEITPPTVHHSPDTRGSISRTSQLGADSTANKERVYSTTPLGLNLATKRSEAQRSIPFPEGAARSNSQKPVEEDLNLNVPPILGNQRVSVSGVSPMSRSRATTGRRQSQGWAQGEEGVVYIDDRAVPESIHGPQTTSLLPILRRGSTYVRLGNETRVESTTPVIVKNGQSAEIPFMEDRRATTAPTHQYSQPSMVASSYSQSFDGSAPTDAMDFEVGYGHKTNGTAEAPPSGDKTPSGRGGVELRDEPPPDAPTTRKTQSAKHAPAHLFELSGKNHLSLRSEHHKGFSLVRSHKKPKIARDWSPGRKRFVATVACISTALVGLLVGMYAAEVPAIQYYIVDFHHYVILGNVFFYIGLAISTFCAWPLPLLHGRKPYILGSMALAMPLLFPQALAVGDFRSPYTAKWRVALLLPRSLMGFVLGFANMNFKSTLTDLFGASLMAANPHQEHVDENDVRRNGGGLGVWLGIWTWCSIGSIGTGFLIGALIINHAPPAIGFYITIAVIALVLFLNIICPEVRRSAFRRSVAEVVKENEVSRRLARGEVKMHLAQSGPKWWGEEFLYGLRLSMKMLRQPGFMVLATYVAWIYGQIVLVVVLLGSLMSKYYMFKSPAIGASVMAVPIGAFLAIPFQKAGFFSRDRTHAEITDDDTRDEKPGWSSHLVRRAIFVICLPFAGLAYTLTSHGPPMPFILPIIFAGLIGFLSCLAMAECHGLIMETYDTSDLQPGMTGRPRSSNKDRNSGKRTNYSSFPRVCSGFAIVQALGYCVAALATGIGGVAERNIGAQATTGVMAGVLLILSILLLLTLMRFRYVQIVPDSKKEAMEKYMDARRKSAAARGDALDDESLRPTIIGNPTHHTRRMNILELGSMSRFSEIRRKNHLVNQNALEAKHHNLAVIRDAEARLIDHERRMMHNVSESVKSASRALSPSGSRRSRTSFKSNFSDERGEEYQMNTMDQVVNDQRDLGGLRDLGDDVGRGVRDGRSQPGSRVATGSGRTKKTRRKTTIQE